MINYYRLDNKEFCGIMGGKAQIAYELCKNKKGIVTCGSRNSVQVLTFAKMCDRLNIPCQVHIPSGKPTDITEKLKETNANIIYEKVGYNNVLNSHAKKSAEDLNYTFIQLGMLCPEAYNIIADNVKELISIYPETKRIVVPVGSGTTMIGICKGLMDLKKEIPVLGIMVGMDATKNIKNNTSYENYNLIKSNLPYNKKYSDPDKILNETYEAKCLPFLEDGDTLYVVAK